MDADLISLRGIFKKSSKLSVSSFAGYGLTVWASFVIARILGPESVGVLALVGVWRFYCGLVRPGLIAAASRDMPHMLGEGREKEARDLQNIAVTGEVVLSLAPVAVMLAAGFFYDSSIVRRTLWLSAIVAEIVMLQTLFTSLLYVYQRFDLLARLRFLNSMVTPVLILLTVSSLGIYSPVLMPSVTGVLALAIVFSHRRIMDYRIAWDWTTARAMLKVGLPLTALTFVGWAYFMSDRPAILAAGVSLAVIGYYSFASNLIQGVAQVFSDFAAVLQPIFWSEIGRRGGVSSLSRDIMRTWVPYMTIACAMATCGQAAFGAVVALVAPKFAPSVPVFEILVFILVFSNSTTLPNLVLNCRAVNRQNFNLALFTIGLVSNILALYAVARSGYSLTVVAIVSMAIDMVIAIIGYSVIHKYIFRSWREALPFYGWLCGLAFVTLGVYLIFRSNSLVYTDGGNLWMPLLRRTLIAVGVWGGVGLILVRWVRRIGGSTSEARCGVQVVPLR
jgi:O-antigen/teichoic acid export membrane protein